MHDAVKPHDLIVLSENLPQHNLLRGRMGRVLEIIAPDEFDVEFVDELGHTVAKVHLKLGQLAVLRHEVTLDEDQFWKLVEQARAETADGERQVQLLVDRLAGMSLADIFAFGEWFHTLSGLAYSRELWTAADIICAGCGNDAFTDFRAWLIAQGKQIFYDALRNPETLADIVPVQDDEYGRRGNTRLEPMNYVDSFAYQKKTGEQMPVFFGRYPHLDLRGEWWDDVATRCHYPKLTMKFQPEADNE